MVSAYGDMENIRSAMNQGAFDFTTKPINLEDLERTIEKAAEQIAFIKQAQREHTQLESIQNDLHVAQEIQQTILPKTFPPFPELKSFDLYAYMNAAKYVGGDFMISSASTRTAWASSLPMCRAKVFPPQSSWLSAGL